MRTWSVVGISLLVVACGTDVETSSGGALQGETPIEQPDTPDAGPSNVGPSSPTPPGCEASSDVPMALASAQFISDIEVDGTHVYFADMMGNINRVPIGGGATTLLGNVSGAYNEFMHLALNDDSVYFAGGTSVGLVPKNGGALVFLANNQNVANSPVVSEGSLFWTEGWTNTTPGAGFTAAIQRISLNGGTMTTLAPNLELPSSIAIDTENVYWVDMAAGTVNQMPLGGGDVTILAAKQVGVQNIGIDTTHVYWLNDTGPVGAAEGQTPPEPSATSTLNRVPIGGGSTTILATGYTLSGLAIDDTHAYWLDIHAKTVNTIPLAGGAAQVLANSPGYIGPVVDGCNVYWTASGEGATSTIERVSKTQGVHP